MPHATQKVLMNIPTDLLNQAIKALKAKTKTQAVILGLEEIMRKKRIQEFLKLRGSGALKLTQKELRRMRSR